MTAVLDAAIVVGLALAVLGLVAYILDARAHRGARRSTAETLVTIVEVLDRIDENTRQSGYATADTLTVAERAEADMRAIRDAVDGMVAR